MSTPANVHAYRVRTYEGNLVTLRGDRLPRRALRALFPNTDLAPSGDGTWKVTHHGQWTLAYVEEHRNTKRSWKR